MNRFSCCVLAVVLTSWGCGDTVPTAPTDSFQPPEGAVEFATVRGWVYARAVSDPPIANARVEVKEAAGGQHAVRTDADGFYELTVRAGDVSITASREGYETKAWEFSLLNDTVLNFGLTPK